MVNDVWRFGLGVDRDEIAYCAVDGTNIIEDFVNACMKIRSVGKKV